MIIFKPHFQVPYAVTDTYWQTLLDTGLLHFRLPEVLQPTLQTVHEMHRIPSNIVFYGFDTDKSQICCEFMLCNFSGLTAQIHFSSHPDYRGNKNISLASQASNWLLGLKRKEDTRPLVRALWGMTPAHNRLAVRLIQKAGYEIKFTLPEAMYIAREDYYDDGIVSMRVL